MQPRKYRRSKDTRTLEERALVTFQKSTLKIIDQANEIINEEGHPMTLRSLYYEFVGKNLIPNTPESYMSFRRRISNARLAGLLKWNMIIDRTRSVESNTHFESPQDILDAAANYYQVDSRDGQEYYIEVWMEKDALLGTVEPLCRKLDVTYLSCRGNCSLTIMQESASRIKEKEKIGQKSLIIYLGDHDPSGLEIIETIKKTLKFFGAKTKVKPIALTMGQVRKFNLPPNPVKEKDSRTPKYISRFGEYSWEIDALKSRVITSLIEKAVGRYTDKNKRDVQIERQAIQKIDLRKVVETAKNELDEL